jgi:hypothetical protein
MWRWRRRARLPAGRQPALAPDERVVAWAGAGDGVLVATTRGLVLPDGARLGWHQIHKATWSGRELTVVPATVVEESSEFAVVEDGPAVTYSLPDPGELPHQVRERVTRSVATSTHYRIAGAGLRVAARRVPGVDGLTWTVRYDPGSDGTDPAVRAETAGLVAEAKAATAGAG